MQVNEAKQSVPLSSAGVVWLKLAMIYLLIGVLMGIAMGATQDFTLRPVHAHVNLLGWATLAVAGLVYTVFPAAGESRLAKVHFWALNLSIPVMIAALTAVLLGHAAVGPILAISEVVALVGIVSFVANVFVNLKSE